MIDTNDSLGQVAAAHPEATHVFLRHRLDFCCQGQEKLADACQRAGLDPDKIVAEIAAEGSTSSKERWDSAPLPTLVEHILSTYHEPLRRDLPRLIEAAQKVERVHGEKPSCPHGLASMLNGLEVELDQHMAKEEQVLFPAIRSGSRGPQVHMPIRVMMQEHDDHGVGLSELRTLTSDFTPPAEACATWRALFSGLEKLERDLMDHIHLENNVLFPRVLNG